MYSSLLNSRIRSFLEERNEIVDEQNGFRPNRSCEDHVFTLNSVIRNKLGKNQSVYATFIDLQKAFDWVNRDLLYFRMLASDIDGKMYQSVKSLYNDTHSTARVNSMYTDWFSVATGVRQGDTLSPTLFCLYINDLAKCLISLGVGVNIDDRKLCVLLYADDIVLLGESKEELQRLLDELWQWCSKWRLKINGEKSNVIHFRNRKVRRCNHVFKIGSLSLDYCDSYKYLGVFFDEHMNFNKATDILADSAGRALGSIISKYKWLQDMGYTTYTKLFESSVKPILCYCYRM